ncbi:MAG: hypothetical protein ACM3QY_12340 [Candidatus Levyibacteriota bacterium]
MKPSTDAATRVSSELSALMETMVDDPDREAPPTLEDVRSVVRARSSAADRREETLHPQQRASLLAEIDDLVDEFGGDAPAIDFVATKASEQLSRVIEVAIEESRIKHQPTLGMVRDAMTAGLIARLAGDGIIDPDQDQTLIAEIDALIGRHGSDAIAEGFMRFE